MIKNTDPPLLSISNLRCAVDETEILHGIDLEVRAGEIHCVMGRNGSGKSTLVNTLMGHPSYVVTSGEIRLGGEEITDWTPDRRARSGLFLAFQYPVALPGVTVASFLRKALKAVHGNGASLREFRRTLTAEMESLGIDPSFARRYTNDGFSGGEKKKLEILQMRMLRPRVALLDETDSGLDVDALRAVSSGIMQAAGPDTGVLLVTHYQRILDHVRPHRVHVFLDGRIARSGGPELAHEVDTRGFEWLEAEVADATPQEASRT